MPILFIDEMHTTVGAGATTGGTMDLATLIKPVLTAGELRVVGSTTLEEFKHIEKDRALARRLQKITIDEPSIEETVKILQGPALPLRGAPRGRYTDDALEAAAKLAARHLRDYRLPDSAIDVLDEAGAKMRLTSVAARASAGERRRGAGEPAPRRSDVAAEIEEVVARMARIPEKQASPRTRSGCARSRRSLGRVVFGQEEAVGGRARHQAIARGPRPARPSGRLLPVHRAPPASARPSSPSSSRCTSATSSSAST